MAKKVIAKSKLKTVSVDNGKAVKTFAAEYNKSDVLYEALNTARVEDAGVDIPKLLGVSVDAKGKWSITSEYVEGPTLTELIEKYPKKKAAYIKKMVEYQVDFQTKTNPLLLKLWDKLSRQIDELKDLDGNIRYELQMRLASMKKHHKLCHGDYCPDNIIVSVDSKGDIKKMTAVDWVHATQGNASADIANTYLLLKLQYPDSDIADKYMDEFCKVTDTKKTYVTSWLPIVAAARLTKGHKEEHDLLMSWVDVSDYQ